MKEIGSGMGTESRLERSKGESRQDNIHLEAGNLHISNNNEGEWDFKTVSPPVYPLYNTKDLSKVSHPFTCISENEETEGSEGQAEYMFGDAELDDDDLYSMEHDNQTGQWLIVETDSSEVRAQVSSAIHLNLRFFL